MATTVRELLILARNEAQRTTAPTHRDADAAIAALTYAAPTLHRTVASGAPTARPWNAVEQLSRACAHAEHQMPTGPGRLPDLVGAACDLISRSAPARLRDDGWAVAVELAATLRPCVEVALRYEPYRRVPTLRWAHASTAAIAHQAARTAAASRASLLDRIAPAPLANTATPSLLDHLGRLEQALRHETTDATLCVASALAVATAAEHAARACAQLVPQPIPWRQTPAAWRTVSAALVRFEDGSRRRTAEPASGLLAATQVTASLGQLLATGSAAGEAATVRLLANHLPGLAQVLETGVHQWRRRHWLFARARDLDRRDDRVQAVLANRSIPADHADTVPLIAAIRVARRLSEALATDLNAPGLPHRRPEAGELRAEARWATRIAQRADYLTEHHARAL